jgi:hypothetical protein
MEEIYTEVRRITPMMAKELLGKNYIKQRKVISSHVWHLAQQMKRGQWILNGAPIIIDKSGNVIDGQHRLLAVIHSGVPCEFLVVCGIDQKAFQTIDRGKNRNTASDLSIAGVANSGLVAATTAAVLNYRRALTVPIKKDGKIIGQGGSLSTYIRASSQDQMAEYFANETSYKIAVNIAMNCKHKAITSATATTVLLALVDGSMGQDRVLNFWDCFKTGANLESTSPILKLRERLEKEKRSEKKMTANHMIMLMVKAWNLYAEGKDCGVLKTDYGVALKVK